MSKEFLKQTPIRHVCNIRTKRKSSKEFENFIHKLMKVLKEFRCNRDYVMRLVVTEFNKYYKFRLDSSCDCVGRASSHRLITVYMI